MAATGGVGEESVSADSHLCPGALSGWGLGGSLAGLMVTGHSFHPKGSDMGDM